MGTACRNELDLRNTERIATSLEEMSRVSAKIRNSTEHMEKLTETLVQVTGDLSDVVRGVKESSRRMELATYAIIGVTVVHLFYVSFLVFGKQAACHLFPTAKTRSAKTNIKKRSTVVLSTCQSAPVP